MKYVVLINVNPDVLDRLSKEDLAAFDEAHRKVNAEASAAGELVDSQELADPEHAAIVRSHGGRLTVTDGPYPEMKEFLGGYYVFDVDSRERAVALARQLPEAAIEGCYIDVRPVMSAVQAAEGAS